MPLYAGGAISTRYSGAAVCAQVAKKDRMNRPPMNMGRLVASAVTTTPTHTPRQPKNMCQVRPYQSVIQMKRAPHIWPTWKMAKTMPVLALPLAGRLKYRV